MINTILQGDVLKKLKIIPDNYVNCCVTSPPYWGLRDYGHDGQIGLEKTPEIYVSRMVEVFNEVKRVLKPDGTLWLNLGDSYAGSGKGAATHPGTNEKWKQGTNKGTHDKTIHTFNNDNYKPKDLIGIPWMVAFALRSAGWYLRSDVIWHKPNPMPESVTDRPTKSHEYIFLMSKSQKYYYDYEAIEEIATGFDGRKDTMMKGSIKYQEPAMPNSTANSMAKNGDERWKFKTKSTFGSRNGELDKLHSGKQYERKYKNLEYDGQQTHTIHKNRLNPDNEEIYPVRNKRSVWTVTTKPYKDAHFATFPQELIIDCIKAGCPEGGIVLDPFMGAGTTAIVARKLNRNYIGIELNEKYISIANKRIEKELGVLFE